MNIFALWGEIEINRKQAEADIKAVEQQAETSGKKMESSFDKVTKVVAAAIKEVDKFGDRMETLGKNLSKKAGVPLAALTALMGGLAKATADYGDRVAKHAQQIGLSVQAYQELEYAMGQNGVSTEEFEMSIGNLNQRLGMARRGNEQYRKTLEKLGFNLDELDKGAISTEESFNQIVAALADMDDGQMQAAIASDFFGTRVARRLLPAIRGGAEGIEELRQRAHDLGLVMDEEFTKRSEVFGDTMDDLSRATGGLGRALGKELLAPFINLGKWITDIVSGVTGWIEENPKLVRQIIIWGGAIAGVLGVLVTLGTTLVITGKIIGALGAIFNVLTSKPMLIIAAIGALYLAWESDWLGIRTAMENAWEVIEPILETLWSWLGEAWKWAINIAGDAWEWLTETTWADKIEDIKGWLTAGWEWLVNVAGSVWDWLTETSWADKIEDIRNWLSNAWSWVLDLGGTAWAWIDENLPWLADAIEWLWDKISAAWQWTITKAGDAWDWLKDSALMQWLDDLKQKITDSKAWQWTIDVALPAVIEGGKAVITAVVEAGGRMYDAIKQGLETGDWSDFWSVTSDVWNAGVAVALSLQMVSGAASWILTAIGSIFGNSAGKLGIGGIPLAIGLLTVGIQLLEAQAEGSYEAFVKNVLVAALVGAIGGAVFGPNGALIGFNLTLSLKLGEKIEDVGKVIEDWGQGVNERLGLPTTDLDLLAEYQEYRQRTIDESNLSWWDKFLGRKPEGLLNFEEWKQAMGYVADDLEKVTEVVGETAEAIEETADDVERLTGELSKLEKQALIVAETLRQGGTIEQALALLGIAYWETRGYGGYAHTDPTTGEVIRGGAGEYGIGQVMPGTGKDVWTRLWRQPAETWDESMLEDLDTNIAMMVSYFLDRYRVHGEDLRLAIEGYNRGTAIDGMQAYTVGVVEWMEGAEGQALADVLYDGMENALEAMVQAGYDMDGDVREMAAYLAQIIADYLVGESPPPEGPLSEVDEGGENVAEAWIEGMVDGVEENAPLLTRALDHIKTLLSSVWEKVPEDIRIPIENAIRQAEEALFSLDDLQEELQRAITGGPSVEDEAQSFMDRLKAALNEKLKQLDEPLNRFADMVSSATLHLGEVVKAVRSGDWVGAILSIIMETESFAKAMELIGKVLAPVVTLFDAVLRPIIEGLLKLWNGIIDALVSINIFGWRPFEGLAKHKVSWDDAGGGSGGRDGGSGGRQISEITGPTRDLLVDLLSPLANFGAIVAPIQDIRNILYERLPNFDAFGMDFAGAGAIGGDIIFESGSIVISSSGTNATELSRDMLDAIEREMARRVNFGIRGRGGRW